jgi:tripartite-type tricarboxylate transporter receptor subunit TctC
MPQLAIFCLTRRDLFTVSAAGLAFSIPGLVPSATAQPLAKTAHILTGFSPGLQDALARLIAGQMKDYAQTIVVENRPGAAGRVAVEAVKTGDADGSMMLIAPLGFMMLFPHVYKTLRYEPRDFTPVSTVASAPTLLTVGRKVPDDVRTLADFVAWCRANPKHATYGTPGAGTTLHFLGAMLGHASGFEYLHVDSGSSERRDRISHYASRQLPGPRPIRGSSCAGDHRSASQPVSSRGPDSGGSRLSAA